MEIFEKIGDAASKTYKYTAEKTSKIAKETKLKMQIGEHKRQIERIYREIGETVYEKFVVDQELNINELKEKCEEIDEITEKIVKCKDEILALRERRVCKNCYEEIEITAHYCPNCGYEQEIIKQEEVEKTDDTNEEETEKIEEDE